MFILISNTRITQSNCLSVTRTLVLVSAFNVKSSEIQIKFLWERNCKNGYLVYNTKKILPYFTEKLFKKY